MAIEITRRALAEVTLAGSGLDGLGGLYLAYDLLGGQRGPLRLLVRSIGYITLFFLGYVLLLGLPYALVGAAGMGVLLTMEYWFASAAGDKVYRPLGLVVFGIFRGTVHGLAAMTIAGIRFSIFFGLLTCVGLTASFLAGFSPSDDYETHSTVRLSRRKIFASILRTLIVSGAGVASALLVDSTLHSLLLGLKLGLAAGIVSAIVGVSSPPIEWWIENLPERRLGAIGIGLIIMGLLLQSLQYWFVIWNVPVL